MAQQQGQVLDQVSAPDPASAGEQQAADQPRAAPAARAPARSTRSRARARHSLALRRALEPSKSRRWPDCRSSNPHPTPIQAKRGPAYFLGNSSRNRDVGRADTATSLSLDPRRGADEPRPAILCHALALAACGAGLMLALLEKQPKHARGEDLRLAATGRCRHCRVDRRVSGRGLLAFELRERFEPRAHSASKAALNAIENRA